MQYFNRRSLKDLSTSLSSSKVKSTATPGVDVKIRAVRYGPAGYSSEFVNLADLAQWLEKATAAAKTGQGRLWLDVCGQDFRVTDLLAHAFGVKPEFIAEAHVRVLPPLHVLPI